MFDRIKFYINANTIQLNLILQGTFAENLQFLLEALKSGKSLCGFSTGFFITY